MITSPSDYFKNDYVGLDFETTNIDKGSAHNHKNRIIIATWVLGVDHPSYKKYGGEVQVTQNINEYDPSTFAVLLDVVERAGFVIAHNVKFEDSWLKRLDITPRLYYCTMLAEYTLAGNQKVSLDLDSTASRYGYPQKDNMIKRLLKGGVCPSEMPRKKLVEYGKHDTAVCVNVFHAQRAVAAELFHLMYTKNLFAPVLNEIEKRGMFLDAERVKKVYGKVRDRYILLEQEMDTITGGINFKSPKQVADFLYNKLKFKEIKGLEGKTDQQTIAKLKPKTKKQVRFIELKKQISVANAELTKALNKFIECVSGSDGGLLKAQFNQTVTATHRLSSTGLKYKVQFQNLPRKFKPLFKARDPDYAIVEADAAQLEFRVAAFAAQDKLAIEDIVNGEDVHQNTADILTAAGQPTTRTPAKSHTFKPLYGGTRGTAAEEAYYKAFKERYAAIAKMQEGWTYTVLHTKELELPTGMIFRWPDCDIYHTGYIKHTTNIYNYPIQYLATGEMIPIFVIFVHKYIQEMNVRGYITNTVHDSVIAEVHKDDIELYKRAIEKAKISSLDYLTTIYKIDYNVPFDIDVSVNEHWSDTKEWQKEWLDVTS